MLMDDIRRNSRYDLPLSTRRRSTSESLAKKVLIKVLRFLPHLVLPRDRDLGFVFFSCGFTLSTSAITSLLGPYCAPSYRPAVEITSRFTLPQEYTRSPFDRLGVANHKRWVVEVLSVCRWAST